MITNYPKAQYWVDGLISGIGNLLGSWIGSTTQANAQKQTNETNLQMNRENNEANLALAKQQNDWNIEQWNRENEYNSPAHQLELIKEAGLNPNFYSGSITANSGASQLTSANLANQVAGHVDAPQGIGQIISNGFSGAADSLLKGKQLEIENKKADAEVENLAANSENTKANTKFLKEFLTPKTEAETKQLEQLTKNLEETNTQIKAQTNLFREQLYNVQLQNKWFDSDKLLQQDQMVSTINNLSKQSAELLSRIGLNKATAYEVSKRAYQNYVSGLLNGDEPTLFDYQMSLMLGQSHQAEANAFNSNMIGEKNRVDLQHWQKHWEIELRKGNAEVYQIWSGTVLNYANSFESLTRSVGNILDYTPLGMFKSANRIAGGSRTASYTDRNGNFAGSYTSTVNPIQY